MTMTLERCADVVSEMVEVGLLLDWEVTLLMHFKGYNPLEGWWITLCRKDDGTKQGLIVDYGHWCQFVTGMISEEDLLQNDWTKITVEVQPTVDADGDRGTRTLRAPQPDGGSE